MTNYMNATRSLLWLHIAAGVFVGTVAANLATWGAAAWATRSAAAEVASQVQAATQKGQEAAQAAERARAQAEIERRRSEAARQRQIEQQKRDQQAEVEKRELAWARFYRKPQACDEARGGSWSVDCANDYIRAKRRFAEQYDANNH